jgi:hypothetical protein
MNEHDESEVSPPPIIPNAAAATAATPADFRPRGISFWTRRLLVCNPFYLLSAALLLFGLYRVSIDHNFLSQEVAQIAFNLTSLQLYEILLVVTAIFLARRSIWYESTLLAGLENMLLFVPFILISQAALLNERCVWAVCLAVSIVAAARVFSLKRFFRELHLPNRLLVIGAVLLVVNVALLVTYRIVERTKIGGKPDSGWDFQVNQFTWLVVLPAALALVNFLPYARETGSLLPQRRWLPTGLFALWIAATGVHLYCLNYVYDFAFRREMIVPFLWVLSWTMYGRAADLFALRGRVWQPALLGLPLAVTLVAATHSGNKTFFTLTALNFGIYAGISLLGRDRRVAWHLLFASGVLLLAGMPELWRHFLLPRFNPETCIVAGLAAYLLLRAALSRDPKHGILGGVLVTLAIVLTGNSTDTLHWALQSGLLFLLLHSFLWDDSMHSGANVVRVMAALFWTAQSFVWMHFDGEPWVGCVSSAVVLGAYGLARFLRGRWDPFILPITAILVLFSGPGNAFAGKVHSTPIGPLAVIGSFLLFALGTVAALTKHRWHHGAQR